MKIRPVEILLVVVLLLCVAICIENQKLKAEVEDFKKEYFELKDSHNHYLEKNIKYLKLLYIYRDAYELMPELAKEKFLQQQKLEGIRRGDDIAAFEKDWETFLECKAKKALEATEE